MVALSPIPPVGWGGAWEEKGKTCGSGEEQFNRTVKESKQ